MTAKREISGLQFRKLQWAIWVTAPRRLAESLARASEAAQLCEHAGVIAHKLSNAGQCAETGKYFEADQHLRAAHSLIQECLYGPDARARFHVCSAVANLEAEVEALIIL